MENYQATPFNGKWNEDPENFLGWFLQCMGTADDNTKASQFVYYLQASSDADEWFEDLPEEEKSSWVIIEMLFRRKWLKGKEISIKESVTSKNEPKPTSTLAAATSPDFTTTLATQTETRNSRHLEISPPTCAATSESLVLFQNRKNTIIPTAKAITSEIFQNFAVFSSLTSSVIPSDSTTPSTTIVTFETRCMTADFTQKHENVEKVPIFTQTSPEILSPSIFGPTDNVTRVYASPPTANDTILQSPRAPTSTTTASTSDPPAATGHKKSALLRAAFNLQVPTESPAPTCIVTALETRSALTGFAKNHQKIEKSPIFNKKPPETGPVQPISLPTNPPTPTKHPCAIATPYSLTKTPGTPLLPPAPPPAPKPPEIDSFSVISTRIFAILFASDLLFQPRHFKLLRARFHLTVLKIPSSSHHKYQNHCLMDISRTLTPIVTVFLASHSANYPLEITSTYAKFHPSIFFDFVTIFYFQLPTYFLLF
jgi:hypothetical protein